MVAWPAAVGAIAQGVGAIGGLRANRRHERRIDRYNAQQQRNWERQFTQSVQARVADARRAGVSPLAALGMSGSPGPLPFQIGRRGGTEHSFQAIGEAAQTATDLMMQNQSLKNRQVELQNQGQMIQNMWNDSMLRNKLGRDRLNMELQRMLMPAQGSIKNPWTEQYSRTPSGALIVHPHPQTTEALEGMAGLGLTGVYQAGRGMREAEPVDMLRFLWEYTLNNAQWLTTGERGQR